jgi:hypothetical protein
MRLRPKTYWSVASFGKAEQARIRFLQDSPTVMFDQLASLAI